MIVCLPQAENGPEAWSTDIGQILINTRINTQNIPLLMAVI